MLLSRFIDLTGKRFGKLIVLRRDNDAIGRGTCWICQCNCGNTKSITTQSLSNGTKSCGCIRIAKITKHGMSGTPFHSVWRDMKDRCDNRHNIQYKSYGGRGITVCERWGGADNGFENFMHDMGSGYRKGLQIDRIDNNKGYSPDNCRWATPIQNARNRRTNVYLSMNGKRMLLVEWAKYLGVKSCSVTDRIKRHRLDGTILVEGGKHDNTKEMQGRNPVWEQSA